MVRDPPQDLDKRAAEPIIETSERTIAYRGGLVQDDGWQWQADDRDRVLRNLKLLAQGRRYGDRDTASYERPRRVSAAHTSGRRPVWGTGQRSTGVFQGRYRQLSWAWGGPAEASSIDI